MNVYRQEPVRERGFCGGPCFVCDVMVYCGETEQSRASREAEGSEAGSD